MPQEDQTRLRVQSRRSTAKEAVPQVVIAERGDFLVIAQGSEIILLSQKEVFANLPKLEKFARGEK